MNDKLLALRRTHRMLNSKRGVQIFCLIYFSILIYLLFFAFFRQGTTTHVNFIPFKSIFTLTTYTFKTGEDWWHWLVNVPGNVVAFLPMPVLVLKLTKKSRKSLLIFLIVLSPFLIEFIQYFFQNGSCDVDDIILNEIGILTGFGIRHLKNQAVVAD